MLSCSVCGRQFDSALLDVTSTGFLCSSCRETKSDQEALERVRRKRTGLYVVAQLAVVGALLLGSGVWLLAQTARSERSVRREIGRQSERMTELETWHAELRASSFSQQLSGAAASTAGLGLAVWVAAFLVRRKPVLSVVVCATALVADGVAKVILLGDVLWSWVHVVLIGALVVTTYLRKHLSYD